MKHAREDYNRIQDPEGKIGEDEPVFILRAHDRIAPDVVDAWADLAEEEGAEKDIVDHARQHARDMRDWQEKHGSKIPDLPKDG